MTGRIAGVLGMAIVLALAALYGFGRRVPPPQAQSANVAETAIPVRTVIFGEGATAKSVKLVGVVQAVREVSISPKAPSRIAEMHVRDGDRVRAGQPLVTLDMGDLQAQIAAARSGVDGARAMLDKAVSGKAARMAELDGAVLEAQGHLDLARTKLKQAQLGVPLEADAATADADKAAAGVAQAQAGLRQAEAGLKEAEDAVRRLEQLHRHGGVADVDLDGARSRAAMARSAVDMARAGLDLALASLKPAARAATARGKMGEADLEAAETAVRLAERSVRIAQSARSEALRIADYDIAGARAQLEQARAGLRQAVAAIGASALVSPINGVVTSLKGKAGEYAQPGLAIMRVVDTEMLQVEASAPVRTVSSLEVGRSARILADAGDQHGLPTRITAIGDTASRDGRTVPVTIAVPKELRGLKPGALVTVVISPRTVSLRHGLPRDALVRRNGGWNAFVIRDGRAVERRVTVREIPDGRLIVVEGLNVGDSVVCPVPDGLRDGAAVRETAL